MHVCSMRVSQFTSQTTHTTSQTLHKTRQQKQQQINHLPPISIWLPSSCCHCCWHRVKCHQCHLPSLCAAGAAEDGHSLACLAGECRVCLPLLSSRCAQACNHHSLTDKNPLSPSPVLYRLFSSAAQTSTSTSYSSGAASPSSATSTSTNSGKSSVTMAGPPSPAGPPPAPTEPGPEECCQRGCKVCVWDGE